MKSIVVSFLLLFSVNAFASETTMQQHYSNKDGYDVITTYRTAEVEGSSLVSIHFFGVVGASLYDNRNTEIVSNCNLSTDKDFRFCRFTNNTEGYSSHVIFAGVIILPNNGGLTLIRNDGTSEKLSPY